MAIQATSAGAIPRTILPTAVALVRGVRVTLASTGLVALCDNTVRGDYVTDAAIAASEPGLAYSMQGGASVPALASEAVAIGDAAYTATSGKFSKTSTSNVLVGVWRGAASGDGVLGVVELHNPA